MLCEMRRGKTEAVNSDKQQMRSQGKKTVLDRKAAECAYYRKAEGISVSINASGESQKRKLSSTTTLQESLQHGVLDRHQKRAWARQPKLAFHQNTFSFLKKKIKVCETSGLHMGPQAICSLHRSQSTGERGACGSVKYPPPHSVNRKH